MAFRTNYIQIDGSINIDGSIYQRGVLFVAGSGGGGAGGGTISWASGNAGSAHQLVTSNGDGSIYAESGLTYNSSILSIGTTDSSKWGYAYTISIINNSSIGTLTSRLNTTDTSLNTLLGRYNKTEVSLGLINVSLNSIYPLTFVNNSSIGTLTSKLALSDASIYALTNKDSSIDVSLNALYAYDDLRWIDINRTGFKDETEVSVGFNSTTYVVDLKKTGANWTYLRAGIAYTFTKDASIQIANPPVNKTTYFITINNNLGNLEVSTTPWTLLDNALPVCTVLWDSSANATQNWQFAEEKHQSLIDRRIHAYLHYTRGTQLISGGIITGPTVGGTTNLTNVFSISQTQLADEDMFETLTALPTPDGSSLSYTCFYRTNASTWSWKDSSVPYLYGATNLIQWDSSGTLTAAANSNALWYNWYLMYTNLKGRARYVMIPGRGAYTSLALAQAENVKTFDFSGFPIAETIIAYQFSWETRSAQTNQGKVRLGATPVAIGSSITSVVVPSPITIHNSQPPKYGAADYWHLSNAEYADLVGKTYVNSSLGIRDTSISNLNTRLNAIEVSIGKYELSLGNPAVTGYILSSTTGGTRSWIAAPNGSTGGSGLTWTAVTSDTSLSVNTGVLGNKATLLILQLPATSTVGQTIRIAGMNSGLWKLTQATSQYVMFGNQSTTVGTSGYLASVLPYDSVELICIIANTGWSVISSIGNITIV